MKWLLAIIFFIININCNAQKKYQPIYVHGGGGCIDCNQPFDMFAINVDWDNSGNIFGTIFIYAPINIFEARWQYDSLYRLMYRNKKLKDSSIVFPDWKVRIKFMDKTWTIKSDMCDMTLGEEIWYINTHYYDGQKPYN